MAFSSGQTLRMAKLAHCSAINTALKFRGYWRLKVVKMSRRGLHVAGWCRCKYGHFSSCWREVQTVMKQVYGV